MQNEQYKKIMDKIKEASLITEKNNSILYEFSINGEKIESTIKLIEHTGEKKTLDKDTLNIENKLYTFLNPLIKEFSKYNKIVLNDFVDINEDNIVTYRLITENNDQLSIDGLTFEDANYIRDIVADLNIEDKEGPKVLGLSDNKGATNVWFVITIILLVGIVILCFSSLI